MFPTRPGLFQAEPIDGRRGVHYEVLIASQRSRAWCWGTRSARRAKLFTAQTMRPLSLYCRSPIVANYWMGIRTEIESRRGSEHERNQ